MASSRELNSAARRQYKTMAPSIKPGETVRLNHHDCPAGEDKRKRLYITRNNGTPRNVCMWYCHNCGYGGAFSMGSHVPARMGTGCVEPKDNSALIKEIVMRSVDICSPEFNEITPVGHLQWLNGVRDKSLCQDLIMFDPVTDSIVFGIWDRDGWAKPRDSSGAPPVIQQRFFRSGGPKCITTKATPDCRARMLWRQIDTSIPDRALVVVEDLLSMYTIAHHGVQAWALCGNNMTVEELVELKNQFSHIIVWLDNDNEQVINNAHKIKQRAMNLGYKTAMELNHKEPKHLTGETITAILNGVRYE